MVRPAVSELANVVDLRGRLPANLAAIAVPLQNLLAQSPPRPRGAASVRVRRTTRRLRRGRAHEAGLQTHPTILAGCGGGCSARSTAIARATIASMLSRGLALSMRHPLRECLATVCAA